MTPLDLFKETKVSIKQSLKSHIGFLVTEELLELLDNIFPEACPPLGTPMDEVWFRSGERNVVNVLRARYEEAQQYNLENN